MFKEHGSLKLSKKWQAVFLAFQDNGKKAKVTTWNETTHYPKTMNWSRMQSLVINEKKV